LSISSRLNKRLNNLRRYYLGVHYYMVDPEYDALRSLDVMEVKRLIDNELLTEDLMLCNDRLRKCVKISRGAKVCKFEVSGHDVILKVDELLNVDIDDLIAHIITSKGETRKVYSPCKGYILIIEELPERPEKYSIYVVGDEYVSELEFRTT